MKKIICCIVVIIIASATFSQSTTLSLALTKQDYLRKGRSQNTIAWFLIAGGVTTATIGSAIQTKEVLDDFGNIFSGSEAKSSNTGDIVGYTGLGIMLSSIPFFISAHKNKKKALSLSVQNEKALYFQNGNFVTCSVPSLSIKIGL